MGGDGGAPMAQPWHNCYQPGPSNNIDNNTDQQNLRVLQFFIIWKLNHCWHLPFVVVHWL